MTICKWRLITEVNHRYLIGAKKNEKIFQVFKKFLSEKVVKYAMKILSKEKKWKKYNENFHCRYWYCNEKRINYLKMIFSLLNLLANETFPISQNY